jgi:YD repeat-containing protein
MKLIIAILILASWAFAAHAGSTTQRDAPTTRFYDSRGNTTGTASTYGNQTRFYDARGNSVGTAVSHGGKR